MNSGSPEKLLVEAGILHKPTDKQVRVINCLGCHWRKASEAGKDRLVYGRQISTCTVLHAGAVSPILSRLAKGGVIRAELENVKTQAVGRGARNYYGPVETDLGEIFRAAVESTAICTKTEPGTVSDSDLDPAVTDFMDKCSPGQLQQIIYYARQRLDVQTDT